LAPIGEAGQYLHPAISPDGTRVATTIASPTGNDIWIFDLRRGTKTRLTFGPTFNSKPVWTPDGKKIIFTSDRKRSWHIYAKSADNSGSEEVVLEEGATPEIAYSASHDGRYIAFVRDSHLIWALPLFGDRKPFPLTKGDLTETEPAISPDGKWMAYTSPQSGRYEIYVTSFPNVGAKSQVSIAGAYTPQWRSDGKELYFMGQDQRLMAVDVDTHGASIEFGTPHALFQASPSTRQNGPYAASDGKRFLINATAQGGSEPLTLVTNWKELLKK
jgi:Tol biopolymer transport system component